MSPRFAAWLAWSLCASCACRSWRSPCCSPLWVGRRRCPEGGVLGETKPSHWSASSVPHTRWSYRLTPSGEPLRVVMGRLGAELSPRRAGGALRRLLPSGESGFATRSWAGQQGASLGMGSIDRLHAVRLTAVPHGATAIAAFEVLGVGRNSGGGDSASRRILLS